jgi:hypothetical protein
MFMHISTCSDLDSEESLSRSLLDTILQVRVDRILSPNILSPRVKHDVRANPRYLILVELRKRVWSKVGWENDGRGVDPWRGRSLDMDGAPATSAMESKNKVPKGGVKESMMVHEWDGIWTTEHGTGMEDLDSILASDPLDLFQWDDWESLAAGFFAG